MVRVDDPGVVDRSVVRGDARLVLHRPMAWAESETEVTPAQREAWEERAAIMEFDGGLSREGAEAAAYADVQRMIARGEVSQKPSVPEDAPKT